MTAGADASPLVGGRNQPAFEMEMRDLKSLGRTVSHYEWGQCVGFDAQGRYEVRTVDRGIIRFDVSTGTRRTTG